MTALATVIIPVSPEHTHTVAHAIASAQAQTLPVDVLVIVDDERRGTAWARNRGIEQVTTEFVVFLDADDTLMPTFLERCWQAFQQTKRYIYTDFIDQHGRLYAMPECAWVNDQWHGVTALIPTAWVRAVDGFDETLRTGGEDSEFFLHLCTTGHCGARLPEPLFVYTNAPDTRSKRWFASPERQAFDRMIEDRYIAKGKTAMGCCTEPATPLEDPNHAAPDKVLARPRWVGNRKERGQATGTFYPPADHSVIIEIDPRDAAARPDHWEVVVRPVPVAPPAPVFQPYVPSVQTVATVSTPPLQQLAQRVLHVMPPPPLVIPPAPAQVVPTQPDFERIKRVTASKVLDTHADALGNPYDIEFKGLGALIQSGHVPPRSNDGGWTRDESTGAEYKTVNIEYVTPVGDWLPGYASVSPMPLSKSTTDPVFVFPDTDYPSYTDVKRLVELSGFEATTVSEADWFEEANTYIVLSPEQPYAFFAPPAAHTIWWSLEYGGEYEPKFEPEFTEFFDELWASDPTWAKAHNAKFVVMGSHPRLADAIRELVVNTKQYDYVQLAYQTPRRQRVDMQLAELSTPKNPYPGYGVERDEQLVNAKLMLHVHQHDTVAAIAPQRFALAAAYKLPLICESVPDAGAYAQYATFVDYQFLNAEVRSRLAMMQMGYPQEGGNQLHQWLCVEHAFRMSVEQALKS